MREKKKKKKDRSTNEQIVWIILNSKENKGSSDSYKSPGNQTITAWELIRILLENRSFLTKQKGEKEIIFLLNSHLFILKWSSIRLKDSSLNAFLPDIVYELRCKIYINQSYWANTQFFGNVAFCQGEYIYFHPFQPSNSQEIFRQKNVFMGIHDNALGWHFHYLG